MTTNKRYPEGQRRGAQQTIDLSAAYNAVFTLQKPTRESLDMVMTDLAEFSGYFAVAPTDTSSNDLWDRNGRRAVFARILSLIRLSEYEREQLRERALLEMQISNVEGER